MLASSLLPVLGAGLAAAQGFGVYRGGNANRLVGSSFGVVGTNATYDYVIVGGGTAGLAVADRLASCEGVTVAVVEAGSFYEISNGNHSQIPAFDFFGTTSAPTDILPLVDWGFVTQNQPQLGGRTLHYTQGKTFGGGSSRNYLAYHRGSVGAYERWANRTGDKSWTFQNLLPFFKKSVAFTPPNYAKRKVGGKVLYDPSAFSSSGGPLHVSYSNYWQPMAAFLQHAYASLGFKAIDGLNSGILEGYTEFTSCIDPAAETRSSSETAFLQDAAVNTQLQIYPQTLVEQITFDATKKATGVKVSTAGYPYYLLANKEVIVSAGVFRSPQLLMLSGIGPAATLQQYNIPVISDLPGVGQNMWDQPYFGITYQVNVTTQSSLSNNLQFYEQATSDYLTSQTGPLTMPGGSVVGFEKIPEHLRKDLSKQAQEDLATFPSDWPELELLPLGAAGGPTPDPLGQYMSINVAVLTTFSRGNVTLGSANAADNPLISPNWLEGKTDQELAVQGFKRAREVAKATGITIGPETIPGPLVQTDDQILSYIKSALAPVHHASATNAMGIQGDEHDPVINTKGQVFGVQGLRVIDVSSLPLLPPGHCQGTVYMVAEKLAQDIIDEAGLTVGR